MIIVTGATGKLGRLVVQELLKLLPAERIGAVTRDPSKAHAFAQQGVRVRFGDFSKPESLAAAFEGAAQVLVVSSNAQSYGGDPLAQHRAAFAAARSAGARRVLYTSHMGASSTSAFSPMHTHAATEQLLRDSGGAWTSLRNGFYASTVPGMIGQAQSTGVLMAPADGKVAWTAHSDLAAAAAIILRDEGCFDGPTPPLTASAAYDLHDVAALLSGLHNKPVRREVVPDDAFAEQMRQRGLPPHVLPILLGMYQAARAGEFQRTDPTLAKLIGRRPEGLAELLSRGA